MDIELFFALLPTVFATCVLVMISDESYKQKMERLKVTVRNIEVHLEINHAEINTLCRNMRVSSWDKSHELTPQLDRRIEDLKRALVLDPIPYVKIEEQRLYDRGLIEYVASIDVVTT